MINSIVIMGRLTSDPELKGTSSGTSVTHARIACDRPFTREKKTDFFNIVAWRSSAEFLARNFTKGMPIVIKGRLQNNEWTDRDGRRHIDAEIIVEELDFAGGEKRTGGAKPVSASAPDFEDLDDDFGECPFDIDTNGDDGLPL